MSNLSFARIMFGTEDFHRLRTIKKPGLSAVAIPLPANHLAWELPTLHELLQKVWQRFTRKG